MDKKIYYRLIGNGSMFLLLATNAFLTTMSMKEKLPDNPQLMVFHKLSYRYATIWNMVVQIFYTALAFSCDFTAVTNFKGVIPERIRNFRLRFFHEIVFPLCFGLLIFWPAYIYDRELIFPKITEIVVAKYQNYIFHGFVFVYVTWELIFLPDQQNKEQFDVLPIALLQAVYILNVVFSRYIHPGAWVYELIGYLEGSILLFGIPYSLFFLSIIAFNYQWALKDFFCKSRSEKIKLL